MSSETHGTGPIPRLALTREEAAAAVGMSLDSFERYVQPDVAMIRVGRMRLVPIAALDDWLARHAERTLPDRVDSARRAA